MPFSVIGGIPRTHISLVVGLEVFEGGFDLYMVAGTLDQCFEYRIVDYLMGIPVIL